MLSHKIHQKRSFKNNKHAGSCTELKAEASDPKMTKEQRLKELIQAKKSYWSYLDQRRWTEHRYPFKRYLSQQTSASHETIKEWLREFNKYNKSIPTAGAIVYSRQPDGVYMLTVRNDNAKIMSMPKGKQEPGEQLCETAVREVLEETGLDLSGLINADSDSVKVKKCCFYQIEADELVDCSNHRTREIQEVRWVRIDDMFKCPQSYSKQTVSAARLIH